jgi:hypothetical protein
MLPEDIVARKAGVYRVVGSNRVWILGAMRDPGFEIELTASYAQNLGPAIEPVVVSDQALAYALIERMNAIATDPAIRMDVQQLLALRVFSSQATANHPSVQVDGASMTLGVLGLLNGLCGTIEGGPHDGKGRIVSSYQEDGGTFLGFLHANETDPA